MFKWRRRKKRGLVGLDIGSGSVKAIELLSKAGQVTLINLGHETLKPDVIADGQIIDSKEVADAIIRALSERRDKTTQAVAAVSGHSTILKNIEVPLMTEEEWAESMDWHAEEHIPYDITDVLLDSQILARSESMKVLLAACKREVAEQRKQALHVVGQGMAILDLAALALANCYIFNYQPAADAPVMLLDIGAASSIINIIKGQQIAFTREPWLGGDLYTEELQRELGLSREQAEEAKRSRGQELGIQGAEIEGVMEALSTALSLEARIASVSEALETEITKTLDFYYSYDDDQARVQKILLSGGGSKLNGLAEFLSSKLELPVERLDPFRRIECDERKVSRERVNDLAPEMAVAVGLALRGTEPEPQFAINLLKWGEARAPVESEPKLKGGKTYRFKARNRLGDLVVGTRVAESSESLKWILQRDGLTLISSAGSRERFSSFISKFKREKVSARELERFTRFFSFMIEFGLPLIQSLQLLATEEKNKYFKQTLDSIITELEEGSMLSAAMARYPKVFDQQYVNMIEAGETGGILDIALARLMNALEKPVKWRRKVKLTLSYPLTAFALLLLTAIVAWTTRLTDSGATAARQGNFLTRVFTSIGTFLTGTGGVVLVVFALVSLISLFLFYRAERGRQRIDKMLLRAPVLGEFLRQKNLARFARMSGTLLSTGVPILQSLDICAEDARNVVFRDAIFHIRDYIERGHIFSDSMTNDDAFAQLDRTVVGIGEQTGALDSVLNKLAEFYEQELDVAVTEAPLTFAPLFIVLYLLIIGLVLYYR